MRRGQSLWQGKQCANCKELWMDLIYEKNKEEYLKKEVGFDCEVLESSSAGDHSLSMKLFFSWYCCILFLLLWQFLLSSFVWFFLFNTPSPSPWILEFPRVPFWPCFSSYSLYLDCFIHSHCFNFLSAAGFQIYIPQWRPLGSRHPFLTAWVSQPGLTHSAFQNV